MTFEGFLFTYWFSKFGLAVDCATAGGLWGSGSAGPWARLSGHCSGPILIVEYIHSMLRVEVVWLLIAETVSTRGKATGKSKSLFSR